MKPRGAPSPEDKIAVGRLLAELDGFGPAEVDASALHLMAGLCRLLGASNAFWVGAVRDPGHARGDPQRGWRGKSVLMLHAGARRRRTTVQAMGRQDEHCPATVAITAGAGALRVRRLGELVDMRGFRRAESYRRFWLPHGIGDRLYGAVPVGAECESYFCIDRAHSHRPFSGREAALLEHALAGTGRLHRELMLSYGLGPSNEPLSPVLRGVLRHLLTGLGEKEIAGRLRISVGTLHQYVVALFRHFRVASRAALASLWLGGESPPSSLRHPDGLWGRPGKPDREPPSSLSRRTRRLRGMRA